MVSLERQQSWISGYVPEFKSVQLLAQNSETQTYVQLLESDSGPKVVKIGPSELIRPEAEALVDQMHPNIVSIYDHGFAVDNKWYWYSMEYLPVNYLDPTALSKLSANEVLSDFNQIISATECIHDKGGFHGDLSWNNCRGRIVEDDSGTATRQPVLLDPKYLQMKIATQTHHTCPYAAPEQYQKEPVFDKRVDFHALGVMLFVLCSQDSLEKISDQVSNYWFREEIEINFRPNLGLNPREKAKIKQFIRICTHFVPEDRYPDIDSLREDLYEVYSNLPFEQA